MVQWLELHVEGSVPGWGTKIRQPKKKKREREREKRVTMANIVLGMFLQLLLMLLRQHAYLWLF